MATYKEIKTYVKTRHGFVPQDCWIAHAKAARRNPDGSVDNRTDISTATKRCSEEKRLAIFEALHRLGHFQ
ncbi:hypothetical protein ATDW_36760 (plasmid) [Asticcacaulis sp. DW145]|uniref:hypothetical protein n=1 Tax=Asticcacaulis sp. DW145 TaxID=3095608 RepID=UPI00308620B8|nr:hypothetical protein ATDW_36760 [Asticcacaulis sp. DW145]